jgi:hypothetical protein
MDIVFIVFGIFFWFCIGFITGYACMEQSLWSESKRQYIRKK